MHVWLNVWQRPLLRIKEALKAQEATSLKEYHPMCVMKLVEEKMHVESPVTTLLVGESENGEVDMNVLDQQRCQNGLMLMVMYQATHGSCGLHEAYDMGDYAFVFDSLEYEKACISRLETKCKNSFVSNPGELGRHMMMDRLENMYLAIRSRWMLSLLLLIMNDLAG